MAVSAPVTEEVSRWVSEDQNHWQTRQERFQKDQESFALSKGDTSDWTRSDSDVMILNDPKVIVQKFARLIARHSGIIEVPALRPELADVAQRIENYLYAWQRAIDQRWISGLNNPYRYDQAFYLCLRGWLCTRTMLRPPVSSGGRQPAGRHRQTQDQIATNVAQAVMDPSDAASLYDHQLFDAAVVYPRVSGGRITRVTHTYDSTLGDLRRDPFLGEVVRGERDFEDQDDRTRLKVAAVYWEDVEGTWWHAVLLGSDFWAKPPTELGYCPWTIVLANGASYRATPWDDTAYAELVGTGVLDATTENQKYMNKTLTKLSTLLSVEANPPVTIYSDGRVRRVGLRPGDRNFLLQRDRLEAHRIGPSSTDYNLLWDILSQRQERGTLPNAFWAEGAGVANTSALLAAGRDMLFPFAEAVNQHDASVYRKVLELYRDFGPGQPLPVRPLPGAPLPATVQELTAQEIAAQGVYVDVSRVDMTPTEQAQKINLAIAMVREGIMSRETARGQDWVGLKNPGREQDRIDQEIEQQALREAELAQIAAPPPQPPGPAPQPPGLPSQALPPMLGTGNLQMNQPTQNPLEADLNAVLAQITGGASGGAGAGGLPPVPGTTGLIPGFPPPGALFGV